MREAVQPQVEAGRHRQVKFVIGFDPIITEFITEAKYMEQLGMPIPYCVRLATLQERQLHHNSTELGLVLRKYHSLLYSLEDVEAEVFEDHLRALTRIMLPAWKRMNWQSLGVADFVSRCNIRINKFRSLYHQMQKNTTDIHIRLVAIANTDLFKFPPPDRLGHPEDCQHFYDLVMAARAKDVAGLVNKYHEIGQILVKIEGIIWSTNTGSCERMRNFYVHWERKVFQALTKLVVNNLKAFNRSISMDFALFTVQALLTVPDVTLHPSPTEVREKLPVVGRV